ncbi:protein involved in gliding motility SprE [Gelidibacter sediminis]|uniref:Protein involved in gliding motility SprE n=1 Tax=Gelidibacter sediminis TaxID=1608710 RepID=A0A4R7Q7E1_9FLAO|nr:protein involved in gliding motility SprE [Gelidibacter sediminis]
MLFLTACIVTSCSRKNDTFINRNFHAMGTKYNILYNGNIALENGRESVDDAFTDNYWELLPVERMETTDDFMLPGQSKNSDFERAEEKAIKAVQKHGMNIKGKEHNPQIDEAYLLLGKARYFDQRFIPAVEAFNYILYKYPASDKINEAKIWREKTNMRLENNELAIKNLKRLLRLEQLDDQDLADASATLAQAYINVKEKDSALMQLKIAAKLTKKNNEKARYNYIRGQLYNEFGYKDSANLAFQKVIDLHRKVPRAYFINAHLAKATNFDATTGDVIMFENYLTELSEDRENRPFLDKIYYRIAEFHKEAHRDSLAIVYYNKSLQAASTDQQLRALDYATLGDMSFDKSEYKKAGAYYDSTLTNMQVDSKPFRSIKRKRENLKDVIYYENIAQVNDSILNLVNLSDEDRTAFFTTYIDKLKAEAEILKAQEEAAQRKANATVVSPITAGNTTTANRTSGINPPGGGGQEFYFYNSTTVAYGKNEFLKKWGDRSLKDNWRLSTTRSNQLSVVSNDLIAEATDEERYDPEFYVATIPTDEKAIDSLIKDRNYAYYQLGVIYKEKFNEYGLAKDKLETLLRNSPEERLILPAKYNLHKTYVLLNDFNTAERMKNDIIKNSPDSRYASILLNPKSEMSRDENSPESVYERIYASYEAQNYQEVIEQSDVYISEFEGEPIVPKFEILKASARGRLNGFEAYKESINFIALNYSNSEEGKRAQEIMNDVIPVLAQNEFQDDAITNKFKVIYQFENAKTEEIDEFLKKLNEEITQIRYYDLSVSKDIYDKNTIFVVVHGLNSIHGARGFADLLEERKANITRPYIAISSPNYEIVQRHKNLNEYLKSQ